MEKVMIFCNFIGPTCYALLPCSVVALTLLGLVVIKMALNEDISPAFEESFLDLKELGQFLGLGGTLYGLLVTFILGKGGQSAMPEFGQALSSSLLGFIVSFISKIGHCTAKRAKYKEGCDE